MMRCDAASECVMRRETMDREILTEEMESVAEIDRDLLDKKLTFWLDGQL